MLLSRAHPNRGVGARRRLFATHQLGRHLADRHQLMHHLVKWQHAATEQEHRPEQRGSGKSGKNRSSCSSPFHGGGAQGLQSTFHQTRGASPYYTSRRAEEFALATRKARKTRLPGESENEEREVQKTLAESTLEMIGFAHAFIARVLSRLTGRSSPRKCIWIQSRHQLDPLVSSFSALIYESRRGRKWFFLPVLLQMRQVSGVLRRLEMRSFSRTSARRFLIALRIPREREVDSLL